MEIERLIQEYTKKAKRLALKKSVLCGVFLGFALNFALAFLLWFVDVGVAITLLLSLGAGLIFGIAAGTVLYFKRFRPTTKSVAEMIDKLGLEERVITMYEMEHEDSDIARLQRKDAKEKISSVSPNQFKFRMTKAAIAALAVLVTLGISMTTASALSAAGVFQAGNEIVGPVDPNNPETDEQTEYVEINYLASVGGTVQGETYQRIEKGKDATAVVAVADEGYSFAEWSDGVMTSERWDWNVMENMTVTAIFLQNKTDSSAGGGEEGEGEAPGEGEGEGEGEGSGEGEGQGGEGGGESQGEGDGEGSGEGQGEGDGDGQGGESEGDPEGDLQGGGGASASGQLDDNTVIDGKTDYSDAVDYEAEKENVENDDSLPPDLKDALSGYLDGVKP